METYKKGGVAKIISSHSNVTSSSKMSSCNLNEIGLKSVSTQKGVLNEYKSVREKHTKWPTKPLRSGLSSNQINNNEIKKNTEEKSDSASENCSEFVGRKAKFPRKRTFSEDEKKKYNSDSNKSSGQLLKRKKLKHNLLSDHIENKKNYSVSKNFPLSHNQYENNTAEKHKNNSKQYSASSLDERTVYVGNLPLNYDHKKVVKLFTKFGEVENARIRCVPVPSQSISKRRAAISKKFHPNRKSAAAYVVFKNKESVSKAIAENGMIIDDHHLRIDNIAPHVKDVKKSIFVGGLPFDIEDDELWAFFHICGDIESVRVIRDKETSMGKGFGYVNFKSSASVELALQLNEQQLKNRTINVQCCYQKKKNHRVQNSHALKNDKISRNKKSWMRKKITDANPLSNDFQGRQAEKKQNNKKRKITRNVIRKKKILAVLAPSSKATKE